LACSFSNAKSFSPALLKECLDFELQNKQTKSIQHTVNSTVTRGYIVW
jgi:hypothetical protein